MIKVDKTHIKERVCQGDIISEVEFIEYAIEKDGQVEISKIIFPYVYVLTQDCDLEQEFNNRQQITNDKHLISVIVAPLYNIEHVYDGSHLSDIKLQMQIIKKNSTDSRILIQNNNPRYHHLEFSDEIPIVNSVIDFKHYFTINNKLLFDLKKNNFICKVSELFRENISHRFSFFLSRIGLPS